MTSIDSMVIVLSEVSTLVMWQWSSSPVPVLVMHREQLSGIISVHVGSISKIKKC